MRGFSAYEFIYGVFCVQLVDGVSVKSYNRLEYYQCYVISVDRHSILDKTP